jgi:hypothetical protein
MTPLGFTLTIFFISIGAGLLGSLLGLGGGIIVVPALTLLFKVDIRYAIGASIISIIATSSGAAAAYVRERMTNLRVAMLLEVATTAGALTGAWLSGILRPQWLFIIFGLMLACSAVGMFRGRREKASSNVPPDPLADRLGLHNVFHDEATGREVRYRVTHTRLGLALMVVAGIASGLLGIGAGILKVPTMDLAMRLPIKVSTATSNFMIGVTAAASTGIYLGRGDVDPTLVAPVALGVLAGAIFGARLLPRMANRHVRWVFLPVLVVIGIQTLLRGFGVGS